MKHPEQILQEWLKQKEWKLADFQQSSVQAVCAGKSGLLNAPTGMGKTYAMFIPAMMRYISSVNAGKKIRSNSIRVLWITPLRALTKDLFRNMNLIISEWKMEWSVGVRTGDMAAKEKIAQKKKMPDVLIITPESLHLFFSQKGYADFFRELDMIVVDEWHELLGSKRGIQTELALSRLRNIRPDLLSWGISATIGNLGQAAEVLLGKKSESAVIIRSSQKKEVQIRSILPDRIEKLPWAGYLGINLLHKVMEVVNNSTTTLLFTNTRSQTEIWYRHIMEHYPELAGLVALHHGSLDREIRNWVEEALHNEKLRLVICTSSLDLGVDFRPVETVIQVGSPKSISRFLQRAGRSGHRPGQKSKIFFVPTHALELIEAVSIRIAAEEEVIEERTPFINAFDVLAQYMVTLAVGDGFREEELYSEVKSTFAYKYLERSDWHWLLEFITTGGQVLTAYDEFKKVEIEDGIYKVKDRKIAMRHRLSMGTIVSDPSLSIKYLSGKYLGSIEENFISRLKPGDAFWFAGMNLEFIRVREMTVQVRKAGAKPGTIPRWMGGRIALSSQLSAYIKDHLNDYLESSSKSPEIKMLTPILRLQEERSAVPSVKEFLIESCITTEGYHLFFFPFEGRLVHEGMASLIAWRISQLMPVTFSIAMNDYGFELLSDRPVDIKMVMENTDLFSTNNLLDDIQRSVNETEMAKRKFREIASIAGLIFQGYPGRKVKTKHLQASSSLFFEVIIENDPKNLLLKQSFQEVLDQQLEEQRLRSTLKKISVLRKVIRNTEAPSPFAFPILVDRLREQLSSEKLDDRIDRMLKRFEKKYADQVGK